MLKIEYVWRELLYQAIELGNPYFQITALSKQFKLSTSMVSHALLPLKELKIIEVKKTRSQTLNAEKLLFFWATRRKLAGDIIYQTYSALTVMEREASLPASVYLTAYSFLRLHHSQVSADYDNIYLYSHAVDELEKRFPQNKKMPNLFVLQADPYLFTYPKTPLAQVFVDLWNLPEWYAREFWQELYEQIKTKVGL